MRKIVFRAFVLLGFTIQACAPLTAATQNADVKAAMQDVGKRDNPHGQGRLFDRPMDSNSLTIRAGDTPKPPQINDHFTSPPALTKNDLSGNLLLAQDYSRPLSEQENNTKRKTAEGTCARCEENFPICVYNAIIYSNAKTEQLRKKAAVEQCSWIDNSCRKQCK